MYVCVYIGNGDPNQNWQWYIIRIQTKPAEMWSKMFTKYNVPEDEKRTWFPEYGTPQGQPLGGQQQRPPLQQNQSPLSTATSAQFGRAGKSTWKHVNQS